MVAKAFTRFLDTALIVVGVAMVAYQMITTQHLFVGAYEHQNIHLGFILVLLFLKALRDATRTWSVILYGALLVLSLCATGYVAVYMTHLEMVIGFPETMDVIVGVVLILLVIAATRHAWGIALPIVAGVFVAYFLFGHYVPEPLYHREFNFDYVVSYLSIGLSGIYGTFLSISANQVFLFVIFGALLEVIKVNDVFFELGKAAGRVFKGGPGQTAIISSSMVGMVTGAAVANVAITGAFTIPFMKRVGYKPEVAGANEATASTGGQLMPPVMGASAYLMASFLGLPYATVMLAALVPAVLYFWGCILGVQFIAVRSGIEPPAERIDRKLIARRLPLFLVPLALLVVMLLMRYSPSLAAFWAIVSALALSVITRDTRPSPMALIRCLAKGALIGAQIGISLAVVGLMAQSLITTGLGTKFAGIVELLSSGLLVPALLITMLVSIILGCGIPTSAAYSLVAIVVVPILVNMGVEDISAHFFAFYFAVISALTPPVALAALAAAGISGGDYMKTALWAFKLAISGFIIPFLVVFNPVMLLRPENWWSGTCALVAIVLGMTAFTAALFNCGLTRFTRMERITAALSAALMLGYTIFRHFSDIPLEYPMLIAGFVMFALLLKGQMRKKREQAATRDVPAQTNPRQMPLSPGG